MSRGIGWAAVLAFAAALPACTTSSGGGGGTTTPSAPAGPTQASIRVTCSPYSVAGSPRVGFDFRITFPCTIVESAGLGANINYVRMRLQLSGADVERQEINANDVIAVQGNNRLNASQSRQGNFIFDFNRGDASGGVLEFNFTDDRGNVQTATIPFTA
jgi:hypothetical protein